jgi:hypothetical protein
MIRGVSATGQTGRNRKKQFADYRLGTSGGRAMHASAMLALSLLQARLIDLNLLLKVKQRS